MSFTGQPSPNTNGNVARGNVAIDLQAALDILAQRSASRVEQDRDNHGKLPNTPLNRSEAISGCGCCLPVNANDPNVVSSSWNAGMKFQGQCIEIGSYADVNDPLASLNDTNIDSETSAVENKFNASLWKNQKEQRDAQHRALARQEELACKLQSLPLKDVIAIVFQAQEGRVETYRFYDE
jgi:hypothetical protein